MNQQRIDQIVAALEWANQDPSNRAVNLKTDYSQGKESLWATKFVGSKCYGIKLKEEDGTDIDALMTIEEKKRDAEELAALQKKLAAKEDA